MQTDFEVEFLDVVNENDEVISIASKDEVYEKTLRHRIVHILIFNDEGEMALQLRSENVSFCPSHWSTSVGGHVQSEETYLEVARREYLEELGTVSDLEEFNKDYYVEDGTPNKFLCTFKSIYNGPFHPDLEDVKKVDFFTMEQIQDMITKEEKFHPELLFLLNKYFL